MVLKEYHFVGVLHDNVTTVVPFFAPLGGGVVDIFCISVTSVLMLVVLLFSSMPTCSYSSKKGSKGDI